MSRELSYVLLSPRAFVKGLSGVILARLLSRSSLELAAARVITLDSVQTTAYAALRSEAAQCPCAGKLVSASFAPANGLPPRTLLLVFQGENAVSTLAETVGPFPPAPVNGAITIRDSYAEFVKDESGSVIYAEPAVFCPETVESARRELAFFADSTENAPNIVRRSGDLTLVILKPENWRRPSIRPGAILDIFTRTGLQLAGCKMHRISVNDALEFYGPVRQALRSKLGPKIAAKAAALVQEHFQFPLTEDGSSALTEAVGRDFADDQFYQIVKFMSGEDPRETPESERNNPGSAKCMVLIFEGDDPVSKIRTVLGPTDPGKADGGTVRGEFGTNIMVNAAHASDSPESYLRESAILRVEENNLSAVIRA